MSNQDTTKRPDAIAPTELVDLGEQPTLAAPKNGPTAGSNPAGLASHERYVIDAQIGHGGMGVVYRAHDLQLGRTVALKVLRGEENPAARARLLREARATAKIRHPNVVVVHDAGELDGQIYLALELLDGVNLRAWLRLRPRSWREILDVLLAAGQGLAAAHAAGLVHRDFKPKSQRSPPLRPCPADPRRSPENRRLEGIGNSSTLPLLPRRALEVGKIWGKRATTSPMNGERRPHALRLQSTATWF